MVALEGDGAFGGFGEVGHLSEFAFGDAGVEVFAAEDVVEVFDVVDPVFAFVAADEDADFVPFASGFGGVEGFVGFGIDRGLVEGVEPAAALGVGGFGVVFELDFGAGCPGGGVRKRGRRRGLASRVGSCRI